MENNITGRDLTVEIEKAISECGLIVTDTNVKRLYPEVLKNAFAISAGERNKNQNTLFDILRAMHEAGLNRTSRIAAVGGGVVGDVTGLAAALYMRGIDWVSVPTTLLAMVDSGIGGKTAVDFCGVKNLVGAFHSPVKTVASAHFLDTLPRREWLCGIGETVKTCLLDREGYRLLQKYDFSRYNEKFDAYELICECVRIKSRVVELDPTEKGLRKILNVGHTVGHALESADSYELSHGEYVAAGMLVEAEMCKDRIDEGFFAELRTMLRKIAVVPNYSGKTVAEHALSDKKNADGLISIITVTSPSETAEVKLSFDEFVKRYDAAAEALK